jgi:hypothetical protein
VLVAEAGAVAGARAGVGTEVLEFNLELEVVGLSKN